MEGNSGGDSNDTIQYAVRMTFGIVHAVILTLFSLGISLYIPSLSHILFALLGCFVAPSVSLCLTIFCTGCVEYVSQSTITMKRILKTAWIPPLGIFCMNTMLIPLEMMPSAGLEGPITSVVATSIVANFILSVILQVYAAKNIQDEVIYSSSKSSGFS
jgi:hypothetical protein